MAKSCGCKGKAKATKAVTAIRKSCKADGTGLSHYVLMGKSKKAK